MTTPVSGQASPLGNNLLPESLEETGSYLWATVTVLLTACMLPIVCKLCQRPFDFFCKKLFERAIKESDEKNKGYLQQISQLEKSKQKLEEENQMLATQVNAYSRDNDKHKNLHLEEIKKHKMTLQEAEATQRQILEINDQHTAENERLRKTINRYQTEAEQLMLATKADHQATMDKYKQANIVLRTRLENAQREAKYYENQLQSNKYDYSELQQAKAEHDQLYKLLRNENKQLLEVTANLKEALSEKENKLERVLAAREVSKNALKTVEQARLDDISKLQDEIEKLNDELQKFKAALLIAEKDLREAKSGSDYNSLLHKGNQVQQHLKSKNNKPLKPNDPDDESIPENKLVDGIDEDIQYYANEVRKMSRNPRTSEVIFPEDSELPFDPNLVCPKCLKQYRVGEIQKLRRHINEFCTGLI